MYGIRKANFDSYAAMLSEEKYIRANYVLSTFARAAVTAIVAGQAALQMDIETFFESFMEYLECYDKIIANPQMTVLETQLDFPKFYDKSMYYELLWYGVAFANKIGEYSVANMF